jgi:MtN3 and saliva related transmembrane protein
VLLVGFLLWLSYGIALGNPAIIIPNIVAAIVCVATIAIAARYRER